MNFRFYIISTGNGTVSGTDSDEVARDYADHEDFFVIDAEDGRCVGEGVEIHDVMAPSSSGL